MLQPTDRKTVDRVDNWHHSVIRGSLTVTDIVVAQSFALILHTKNTVDFTRQPVTATESVRLRRNAYSTPIAVLVSQISTVVDHLATVPLRVTEA